MQTTATMSQRARAVETLESALSDLEESLVNLCSFPEEYSMDDHDWWESVDYAATCADGSPEFMELRGIIANLSDLRDRLVSAVAAVGAME